MKKFWTWGAAFLFALTMQAQQVSDPVLMEIDGKPVYRSEFEYIYNKNNAGKELSKKKLDEYVDLFVNFKLKVAEAEAQGLDTIPAFLSEYKSYRAQLAKSYLTDKDVEEAYVRNIYEHMKENVEASHILINCMEDAAPEDTLAAYNRAMEVYNKLKNGGDFVTIAKEYSQDPSVVKNNGYLGFFGALQMVTPFENAAYALQPGEVSLPVRSRFGYHIIKLHSRRPDMGEVRVAHIFKYLPQSATEEERNSAKVQMDSVYAALTKGADFGEMALTYSDDKGSASRGGILDWLKPNMTIPEFEKVAFSLQDGQMSEPFSSPIGYHIVKRLEHRDVGTYEEEKGKIMMALNRMGENDKGQKAFIARLKKEYNMSDLNRASYDLLLNIAPKAELGDSLYMVALGNRNDVLYTLDGKSYGVQDFMDFANGYKRISKRNRSRALHSLMEVYADKIVLDYEDSKLEQKHPDFALLAREYRDGILLFNISNKEVWEKASEDEEGMAAYFKKHKRDYRWDKPRFKGLVIHCVSDSLEKPIIELLKGVPEEEQVATVLKAFNTDSVKLVSAKRGLFVKGDNPYVDCLRFKGKAFEPVANFPYTFVYGKVLKKGPESYKDVRGPVSADYQTYLEKKWIEDLRKKYEGKIIIHEDVLKTVNNH